MSHRDAAMKVAVSKKKASRARYASVTKTFPEKNHDGLRELCEVLANDVKYFRLEP